MEEPATPSTLEEQEEKRKIRKLFHLFADVKNKNNRQLSSPIKIKKLWQYIQNAANFNIKSEAELAKLLKKMEKNSIMMEKDKIFFLG